MDQTPKIILERIIRALISIIPIAGSPLEQLTFGLKESFENKELLEKIAQMEQHIRQLTTEGISRDLILQQIQLSDVFSQAELLISGSPIPGNTQIAISAHYHPVLALNLLKNRQNLKDVEKKIEELENGQQAMYNQLNEVISSIDYIKTLVSTQKDSFSFEIVSIGTLKATAQKMGVSCQIGLSKKLQLLVPPAFFHHYLSYPLTDIGTEAIFMTYIMEKQTIGFRIFLGDMPEYKAIIKHPRYNGKSWEFFTDQVSHHIFTRQKTAAFFSKCKSLPSRDFKSKLSTEDERKMFDVLFAAFKFSTIGRPNFIKHLYVDALRFLKFEQLIENSTTIVIPVSGKRGQIVYQIMRENGFITDLEKNHHVTSAEAIALASYFKTKKSLFDIVQRFHRLYSVLNNHKDNKLEFDGVAEIKQFLSDVSLLNRHLKSFKADLKGKVVYPLYQKREQLKQINTAYLEFFQAYGEVEYQIKTALTFYHQKLDFS